MFEPAFVIFCCAFSSAIGYHRHFVAQWDLEDDVEDAELTGKEIFKTTIYLDGGQNVSFTEDEKRRLVIMHNFYRENVSPSSSNMNYIDWDEELAEMAQQWSERCRLRHNHYTLAGQNLYMGWDRQGSRALFMWHREQMHFHYRANRCTEGKQCGHYTQMVWANSRKLGCGVSRCRKRFFIICLYLPAGNIAGQWPYKSGQPCSECQESDMCSQLTLCVTPSKCQERKVQCSPICPTIRNQSQVQNKNADYSTAPRKYFQDSKISFLIYVVYYCLCVKWFC